MIAGLPPTAPIPRPRLAKPNNAELLHSLQQLPITELPEFLRTSLMLQYDEARNRTAWGKLVPPSASLLFFREK